MNYNAVRNLGAPVGVAEVKISSSVRVLDGCPLAAAAAHRIESIMAEMSQDFEIAIEEGATMIRLGTTLFGKR